MLSWAVTFLVVAIIAGVLGLSGIAGTATSVAYVVFDIFIILAVIGFRDLIYHRMGVNRWPDTTTKVSPFTHGRQLQHR